MEEGDRLEKGSTPGGRSNCAQCGKKYRRTSKPLTAFDQDLEAVGTVHTGCADSWARKTGVGPANCMAGHPETTRRLLWVRADREAGSDPAMRMIFPDSGDVEEAVMRYTGAQGTAETGRWKARVAELETRYRERFPERLPGPTASPGT